MNQANSGRRIFCSKHPIEQKSVLNPVLSFRNSHRIPLKSFISHTINHISICHTIIKVYHSNLMLDIKCFHIKTLGCKEENFQWGEGYFENFENFNLPYTCQMFEKRPFRSKLLGGGGGQLPLCMKMKKTAMWSNNAGWTMLDTHFKHIYVNFISNTVINKGIFFLIVRHHFRYFLIWHLSDLTILAKSVEITFTSF